MLHRPNGPAKAHGPRRVKRTIRTLLSPEQFNAAIVRESARVDRGGTGDLSLVVFRITGASQNALSSVRLIHTILKRIRVTDDLGWFDKTHVGLLLPDTPINGAWGLAQAVCEVVAPHGARPLCTMYTYPAEKQEAETAHNVIRSDEPEHRVKVAS